MSARKKLPAASAPPSPSTSLTCHAPHPDPARKGQPCGSPLGHHVGAFEFDTTAKRMPAEPDGCTWVRCSRDSCKAWNRFAPAVEMSTNVQSAASVSLEDRLAALPLPKQVAAQALAGGVPVPMIAAAIARDEKTVRRWRDEDPAFLAIVLELRPAIASTTVTNMLEFFQAAAKTNAEKGETADLRWFLDRTIFFPNKLALARAAKPDGQSINVNVAQQQQATQGAIASIWEKRGARPGAQEE